MLVSMLMEHRFNQMLRSTFYRIKLCCWAFDHHFAHAPGMVSIERSGVTNKGAVRFGLCFSVVGKLMIKPAVGAPRSSAAFVFNNYRFSEK